jgi:hypothetical protein
MYQFNDMLVIAWQKAQKAEILRDFEERDIARFSSNRSPNLAFRAAEWVGDNLIRLGHKLKDGDNSKFSPKHLSVDCD